MIHIGPKHEKVSRIGYSEKLAHPGVITKEVVKPLLVTL